MKEIEALVVVFDDPSPVDPARLQGLGGTVGVLSFVPHRAALDALVEAIRRAPGVEAVTPIDARERFDKAADRARTKFLDLLAAWPTIPLSNGRTFKESFTHRGELSLWWLTDLSERGVVASHTFERLCQLEALEEIVSSFHPHSATLLTRSRPLHVVAERLLARAGIIVRSRRPPRAHSLWRSLPVLLLRRLYRAGVELPAKAVAFRLASLGIHGDRRGRPAVVFHSWYPEEWTEVNGELRDRYYATLPDHLERSDGLTCLYLCRAISLNGTRWWLPRLLIDWVREQRSSPRLGRDFIERHLSPTRLVARACDPRVPIRYWLMEVFDPRFRASFRYGDLDIFELLRDPMRRSMIVGVPLLLAVADGVRGFFRAVGGDCFVTFLEMYAYGRAAVYGAAGGRPRPRTVWFQHSAITKYRLMFCYRRRELLPQPERPDDWITNMPLPDIFLVHGPFAQRIVSDGFPAERTVVTGGPRFDALAALALPNGRRRLGPDVPDRRRTALVTLPIDAPQARDLLEMVLQVAASRADTDVVVKPHPNGAGVADLVRTMGDRQAFGDHVVRQDNIHDLIRSSDVLITTNSTTGAEAIALGCPVVNVSLAAVPDLSPFSEVEGAALVAANADELREALADVYQDTARARACRAKWPELLEGTFFRLDGRATGRSARAITTLLAGGGDP